jgi:adenylate kinase
MKNIVFLGPPGSGKGTQINELEKYLDFTVISSGDMVRELAEKNQQIKQLLEKGELVSDNVLLSEVDRQIGIIDKSRGIFFDGFPRTLNQAKKMDEILINHERVLDAAIYIYLEEEEVVKRLARRRVCRKCGRPFFDSPRCPSCGGQPVIRKDDNEATIINRMQVFLEQTLPLVDYYETRNILLQINGNQSIKNVGRDIKKGLGL